MHVSKIGYGCNSCSCCPPLQNIMDRRLAVKIRDRARPNCFNSKPFWRAGMLTSILAPWIDDSPCLFAVVFMNSIVFWFVSAGATSRTLLWYGHGPGSIPNNWDNTGQQLIVCDMLWVSIIVFLQFFINWKQHTENHQPRLPIINHQ